MYILYKNIFVRFHSIENKVCIFPKNLEKLSLQLPLASHARKNYINFQNQYITCKILHDSMQWNPRQNYHKNFGINGKTAPLTELHITTMSYILNPNYIIVINNDTYFVYEFLRNFIPQKPRPAYSKNSGKSVSATSFVERFSPKVDRNRFRFRINEILWISS